jgi:hypothetical protein
MPKPFARPRIEMGKSNREWAQVQARQLQVGDVISNRGLVRSTASNLPGESSYGFYLGQNTAPTWFDPEDIVFAFTART